MTPRDRQPPRRALGDVRGQKAERLSEYFNFTQFPDKAELKVRRNELAAILAQLERARAERKLRVRLWRWLTTRKPPTPAPEATP